MQRDIVRPDGSASRPRSTRSASTGFTAWRRHRLPDPAGLGRLLRPRAGRADGRRDRRRDARRSASTRASRRCWTWCATPAGAAPRRPSARTRTWSGRSAPRTCGAWSPPGSSRRSSTSPATPPPGAARNHAPVSIGPRELADVILPPFEMALRDGGARSVMHSYAEIDGVPAAAERGLLTGLLRDEWGFAGTVVADYFGIPFLEPCTASRRTPEARGRPGAGRGRRRRAAHRALLRRAAGRRGATRATSTRPWSTGRCAGC